VIELAEAAYLDCTGKRLVGFGADEVVNGHRHGIARRRLRRGLRPPRPAMETFTISEQAQQAPQVKF
jgi:hypothetical protein